jgi:hypothetical protein
MSEERAADVMYADTPAEPPKPAAPNTARPADALYATEKPPAESPKPAPKADITHSRPADAIYAKDSAAPLAQRNPDAEVARDPESPGEVMYAKDEDAEGESQADDPRPTVQLFEDLSFRIPEGWSVDEGVMANVLGPLVERHQLSGKAVQELVDFHVNSLGQHAKEMHAHMEESFSKLQSDWKAQAGRDREIAEMGGLDNAVTKAKSVLAEYDPNSEFRGFLKEWGLLNNPQLIKFLARVEKATSLRRVMGIR